jgi:hypothetical protein
MVTYLTVTIDTEEDNWGELDRPSYTVENITRIPRLQDVFRRRGVRPTYLISYPVATSREGVEILGALQRDGQCEIGTHPHPWNTPPLEENRTQINSYICNLPPALQYEKIKTLTETIAANFGRRPTSYRSGRWGFNDDVAKNLIRLGYVVDTTIFPAWNWGPDGPDFSAQSLVPSLYRAAGSSAPLLEVPPTAGFLQGTGALLSSAFHAINGLPFGDKVLAGLRRIGILTRVCLSPEIEGAPKMIELARCVIGRGARVVNMFFHSPSLLEGRTPFVRTAADLDAFIARIDAFLAYAQAAGLRSVTMSELSAERVGAQTTHELSSHNGAAA